MFLLVCRKQQDLAGEKTTAGLRQLSCDPLSQAETESLSFFRKGTEEGNERGKIYCVQLLSYGILSHFLGYTLVSPSSDASILNKREGEKSHKHCGLALEGGAGRSRPDQDQVCDFFKLLWMFSTMKV